MERLSEKSKTMFKKLFEKLDRSYFPPVRTSISAIRRKYSSAQERQYTPWSTLWYYLCDHEEDMRKWDGKPTLTLKAGVSELEGKTIITDEGSPRKIATPVYSGEFSRWSRRTDLASDHSGGTSDWY